MCKWGTHKKVKLADRNLQGYTLERHKKIAKKRGLKDDEEFIDSCIAPIVQALNNYKIGTKVSCCGHGRPLGDIYLQDGRVLLIDNKGEWINHRYRLLIKALWIHFIYPKRIWFRIKRDNFIWRIKNW